MKAYLIDPFERTVTEVSYSGVYQTIYDFIKCDTFTCADFNEHGDTFYVDDEGLFKANRAFFEHPGYPQPLSGYGLVLGTDEAGDSKAPHVSLSDLTANIRWYSEQTIRFHSALQN